MKGSLIAQSMGMLLKETAKPITEKEERFENVKELVQKDEFKDEEVKVEEVNEDILCVAIAFWLYL